MKQAKFSADFFSNNRQNLVKQLPENAVVIVAGYGEMQRGHDAAQPFEQEASFWYLSGVEAPDWQLMFDGSKTYLISPEVDRTKQIFDGSLDDHTALQTSGADEVVDRQTALELWQKWAADKRPVYTPFGEKWISRHAGFDLNSAPLKLQRQLKKIFGKAGDCTLEILRLRTIKQPLEISAIEDAINITIQAFGKLRADLSELKYEYQAEALLTYLIRKNGARGHAYSPIVAAGVNACILHYDRNDQPVLPGDMLLIDVGARGQAGYAADITRTYCVRPSQRQQDVHAAVAKAQRACIELIKPGLSFADYQKQSDQIMQEATSSLGLDEDRFRDYFPHAIGHGLGIDVHDTLAGYKTMQPGMVLTVEPGIYIAEESIGVRIEDDILVTDTGRRNLSKDLPINI